MLTISLRLWSFCTIVTIGVAATGCAAETSDPVATASEDAVTKDEADDAATREAADDDVVARRDDELEMLARGTDPGEPVSRMLPFEAAPRAPNPCPGQLTPLPQAW